MMTLDEIKGTLWLYATHVQHPWQTHEAYANLKDGGKLVIDGLIWGLQQGGVDMKVLVLSLLQQFFADAKRVLPAVRALISDAEHRLVRVTAINTAHVMGDTSDDLIPLLTPRLASEDDFERIFSAGNLWRICRSEDAYVVLRRDTAQKDSPMAEIAQGCFDDVEFPIRPEAAEDRDAIRLVHQAAFGGNAEADLVDALREGGFVELSLVVETDGEVIGHILFSRVAIVTKVGTVDALSLAPMAVVPEHQRKGIGTRLLWEGIAACTKLGHRIVLVLGHPEFYSEFGFSAELAQHIESPFGGGEAWMAQELWPDSLKGVEGRVEFSPPFMALL
jgi:putative acetyltransferase